LIIQSCDQTKSGYEVFNVVIRATLQALKVTLPSKLKIRIAVQGGNYAFGGFSSIVVCFVLVDFGGFETVKNSTWRH